MVEEEKTKVEQIIEDINNLSEAEKRELTVAVRTTPEGNKAYVAFLYGKGRIATAPPEPPTPVPPTPSPSLPTSKEEQPTEETLTTEENNNSSNTNDEWL